MWSVWTLLVTFKTLDNGAQIKGSLTFVVACMNKIFEFCGSRPGLDWFGLGIESRIIYCSDLISTGSQPSLT